PFTARKYRACCLLLRTKTLLSRNERRLGAHRWELTGGKLASVLRVELQQLVFADAMAEIAKAFATRACLLEVHKRRQEGCHDIWLGDHVFIEEAQAIAEQPPAQEQRVLTAGLAHQAD